MTGIPQIDIGPLRPEESDAFLAVMCEAFGMDVEAARPIFYADPYFEPANKHVLRIDGEIVSCLTVVDRACWIGDAVVRIAGIAGVSTRSALQRRGFAGKLISAVVGALKDSGFHMAVLFPVNRAYYERLGWETAGVQYSARRMAPEPTGLYPSFPVRKAVPPDIPAVARLYDRASMGRALHCLRDEKRWRYLFTYLPNSVVACAPDDEVEGYLLCDSRDALSGEEGVAGSAGAPTALRVLEMAGVTEGARRALREFVRLNADSAGFEYAGQPDILIQNGFEVEGDAEPSFMARIIDWHGLLTALTANWRGSDAEVALALSDPNAGDAPQAAIVRCSGGHTTVERSDPSDLIGRKVLIVGDIRGWSAVAAGHRGARSACEVGSLKAASAEAVATAEMLFPARDPFIPPADHF